MPPFPRRRGHMTRKSFFVLSLGAAMVLSPRILEAQTPRLELLRAMRQRPEDPWPRGQGHVLLAAPGSSEGDKSYHEPGGSFSPRFGSFGVSIWITDNGGKILATSDSLPLNKVQQNLVWPNGQRLPAIETVTPCYRARWSLKDASRWQLNLDLTTADDKRVVLAIRSAGPAGGPIEQCEWDSKRLRINRRWTMVLSPAPASVSLGNEGAAGWQVSGAGVNACTSEEGWGFARLELRGAKEWTLTIRDEQPPPAPLLAYSSTASGLELNLPDPQFAACLNAQVAHLMMGLVNNETRPGDPNNYPLNWLRDGAHTIVALARAGRTETARQLCAPFSEQDFFGGFGAEADGPGLALWALEETAAGARDEGFERRLWPHVQRKAGLILEMLSAAGPLRKPYLGPIVPQHKNRKDLDLVCGQARDGLIAGRMDWHQPILFVNAAAYHGLRCAAELAKRLDKEAEAQAWYGRAEELKAAWAKGFETSEADNERTYICGLFPTWVVSDKDKYQRKLAARRAASHDGQERLKGRPLWTYFTVAEAHQWLMLGQPEKVWSDLRWFWDNQASPGLFTWWEGNGEENTFQRWEEARGWVAPPHVTPHYWTAAEMLLLQLDMLACLDESGREPVLVIGPGIPKEWLNGPLSVKGLSTRLGKVDWEWREGQVTVRLRGNRCALKLGPAFKPDTPLKLRD